MLVGQAAKNFNQTYFILTLACTVRGYVAICHNINTLWMTGSPLPSFYDYSVNSVAIALIHSSVPTKQPRPLIAVHQHEQ